MSWAKVNHILKVLCVVFSISRRCFTVKFNFTVDVTAQELPSQFPCLYQTLLICWWVSKRHFWFWIKSVLLLYAQTGSWIFRNNLWGGIIKLNVTIKCSTCAILFVSVIFSENPTHNTFKKKKNILLFCQGNDKEICLIVILILLLVSYTDFFCFFLNIFKK